MGDFAGALAGMGMLALIAALVVAFLREIGALKKDAAKKIVRTAAAALGAGCVYWLVGALMAQVTFGNLQSPADIGQVFRGPYVQRMLRALEEPVFTDPLSWLFSLLGNVLGRVLFGRYLLAGMTLAWGMTAAALCLLRAALERVSDPETAEDAAFFVMCLPGAVFFFLPGCASLTLLLAALLAYGLADRYKGSWRVKKMHQGAYAVTMTLCALLSAAVIAGLTLGRLG